jgi:hypothetical protein
MVLQHHFCFSFYYVKKNHFSSHEIIHAIHESWQNQSNIPSLPKFEVGLDNKTMDMNKLLEKVSIIGSVGMDGIGKPLSIRKYTIWSTSNMINVVT